MKQAFIIMQIGNSDLDIVCRDAIVPALEACSLDPKRVDKHNQGHLLKSEVVGFIRTADIIIADLTNARPNCYLEVGYAMGLDKFQNLILTAREDHNQDSPNYQKDGPKIHFDLSGYDILFWERSNLKGFKNELEKRVRRRLEEVDMKSNDLSEKAKELLIKASKNGQIIKKSSGAGLTIQINNENLAANATPEEEASLEDAIKELESENFIEDKKRAGEVFLVTKDGHRLAKELEKNNNRNT